MILVTGGAGFIGSHLCDRLLGEGYDVLCLDNFNDFYDPEIKEQNLSQALRYSNFTLVRGDILDKELLHSLFLKYEIEQVVHLAAMSGVRASIKSPAKYIDVNIKGTLNLLEIACARGTSASGAKQFIFGSSSSVYGVNKKVPFSENDPIELQTSPYGVTKRAGEICCKTYYHLYGIPITILRFFTIYGDRQRPDMAIRKFTQLLVEDKPIPIYGDGSSQRDYTYIDDCINGIMLAIRRGESPTRPYFEIFNIGKGETIKLHHLIELISTCASVTTPKICTIPEQEGDVPITYADISKARKLLGYDPKTGIAEGVQKFVQRFRSPQSERG